MNDGDIKFAEWIKQNKLAWEQIKSQFLITVAQDVEYLSVYDLIGWLKIQHPNIVENYTEFKVPHDLIPFMSRRLRAIYPPADSIMRFETKYALTDEQAEEILSL